jgi:uncharacterized membrane protein
MLATILWIGGLSAVVLLVLPAARQGLEVEQYARLLEKIERRLDPLGWLSLAVLLGTGLFQMSANPNYAGFLAINNRWAIAILIKHLLFLVMIAVSAYLTWGLLPTLRRIALLRARGQEVAGAERLVQRELVLLRLNLILAVVILALTSLARAS